MTREPYKKTPEIVSKARKLLAEGLGYEAIGKIVGASGTTVHCWLDAEFAANRRRIINEARQGKHTTLALHRVDVRPSAEDIERGFRAIPKDTRDLTGRICGDPLPGRRAIDLVTPRTERPPNILFGENCRSAIDRENGLGH